MATEATHTTGSNGHGAQKMTLGWLKALIIAIVTPAWLVFLYRVTRWYSIKYWSMSCAITLGLRWRQGGKDKVMEELHGIFNDWYEPVRLFLAAHKTSWRDVYERLAVSLASMSMYINCYGLLSPLLYGVIINPLVIGYKLFNIFWERDQHFEPPLNTLYKDRSTEYIMTVFWEVATLGALTAAYTGFLMVTLMFNHRYFAHRSFKASRLWSFVLAAFGCAAFQGGPLWWASTHRRHHRHCETENDPHCPGISGFAYAHVGWCCNRHNFAIRLHYVRDWMNAQPEILLIDLFHGVFGKLIAQGFLNPVGMAVVKWWMPEQASWIVMAALTYGTNFAYHLASAINSWCHNWHEPEPKPQTGAIVKPDTDLHLEDVNGTKQAASWVPCIGLDIWYVGLMSGGEGFHGRHHQNGKLALHAPRWYMDYSYCVICIMEKFRLVWDVCRLDEKQDAKQD